MGSTSKNIGLLKGPIYPYCTAVDPPFSTVDCPIKFEQDSFNFLGTDNQTVFDRV